MTIFDEYANILKGMYSIRFNGRPDPGGTSSIETTEITSTGTISANLFQGSGKELTNLNASNISDGTLAVSRGGTGLSTLASGQLLIGNDTGNIVQTSNLIF
jgi:hypothetical protein